MRGRHVDPDTLRAVQMGSLNGKPEATAEKVVG
jgi:hypothetical protein